MSEPTKTHSTVEDVAGRVSGLKARVQAYRATHPWLQHVIDAWQLLSRNNGNQYAAAITYFSFLALFPLLLLAVSITGFVLHSDPGLEQDFFDAVARNAPGQLGRSLHTGLQDAINARAGVGVVGVLGVALAGGAWIGNLRQAIDGVWGRTPAKVNIVVGRVKNLGVLLGLGISLLVSLGLTAVGTSVTDQLLRAIGLDDLPGAHVALRILGIAIAAAGDAVIFWWILVRLPQQVVPRRVAVQGAVLAAVGFEVLKILGSYTIAASTHSATAGPLGGLLAVLIWIQLVARYMLFTCAWMATAVNRSRAATTAAAHVAEVDGSSANGEHRSPNAAAVGVTLVGVGALAGAAASWAASPRGRRRIRRYRRRRPTPPPVSSQPW